MEQLQVLETEKYAYDKPCVYSKCSLLQIMRTDFSVVKMHLSISQKLMSEYYRKL